MDGISNGATRAAARFWEELLPGTLQNAARTNFYRDHWDGIDLATIGLDTLPRLPMVDKSLLHAAGRDAQLRADILCDEVFTSGTTGRPFITVRGNREQAFIRRFYGEVNQIDPTKPYVRGLQINNPYHGSLVAIPTPIHFHRIGIYDAHSFQHGLDILTGTHNDPHVEPQCSVLVALERPLRAFADCARARFPDGIRAGLRSVVTYSQYVTSGWRRFFEETFGAPVIDRYSLSEIFGGATEDLRCGFMHFDPVVIPEVIAAGSGEPIKEGVGSLLLTSLYPFQQAQPMVRYNTGDLVRVTHDCGCGREGLAIKPLGRSRYGVRSHDGNDWLLTPADFLEAVDELKDLRRAPRFLDSPQIRDPYKIGNPRYETRHAQAQDGSVRIEIILDVEPAAVAERGLALRDQVIRDLRKRSALLDAHCQSGKAHVDVRFSDDVNVQLIANA